VTFSQRFRFEVFLARQVDEEPQQETLEASGLVFKWSF
jgi:hypothetical protein